MVIFISGQLIHSIELPYKNEYIADENFQSTGSDIDKVIEDLRSHNWYTQEFALSRLVHISPTTIDDNTLFLLGRNILQTAIGGEHSANFIIKNLDNWLLKYFTGEDNHVLNGILFEVYFNSKGQFRQRNFKNELIDEVFKLQLNPKFKPSFDFILKQLSAFKDFIFYFPTNPPTALPIEVKFELFEQQFGDKKSSVHKLVSIKHEEIELLEPYEDNEFNTSSVNIENFIEKLHKELCVPKKLLRLSINMKQEDVKRIYMPWTLHLTRQKR